MKLGVKSQIFAGLAVAALFVNVVVAGDHGGGHGGASGEACVGFGPQTPRDIDHLVGDNKRLFTIAPPSTEMNLCNIHFHENAEHKAKAFSIYAGDGNHGYDSGYLMWYQQEAEQG